MSCTSLEQRGVTEVEVRAMRERATSFKPNVVDGKFMTPVRHLQPSVLAIVEPVAKEKSLVVVTVNKVSEMTERSLQVTYRKGRAFAAYLHLSHPTGEKSAKTSGRSHGVSALQILSTSAFKETLERSRTEC